MKSNYRNWIWIAAIIVAGVASFFSGKALFYKDGFQDGVIFADSSSYKRGKSDGFNEGYEYCDNINDSLQRARSNEMFNLNIIYEELGNPKNFIKIQGEIAFKDSGNGVTSRSGKYVKGQIINNASFARYNELVVIATFKDRREGVIKEVNVKLPDILYPRKRINFEIPDVPELAESVELILDSAQGMD